MLPETGITVESLEQARRLVQVEKPPFIFRFQAVRGETSGKMIYFCKRTEDALQILDQADREEKHFSKFELTVHPAVVVGV